MLAEYVFDELEIELCHIFARLCISSNLDILKKRNQTYVPKLIKDIQQGKLAELLMFNYINDTYKKEVKTSLYIAPDFNVYPKYLKSFDADITLGDKHYHVKSILRSNAEKFGTSFMFEKNDPIVNKPKDNHYLCLVRLEDDLSSGILLDIVNSTDVEYKEPRNRALKTKCVLYLE